MRPISKKVKDVLLKDPRMRFCGINDHDCEGKIDFHHVWIYGGKQLDEPWAIVGACQFHHRQAENPPIKRKFQIISLKQATKEDLLKYNKKDWNQLCKYLNVTIYSP